MSIATCVVSARCRTLSHGCHHLYKPKSFISVNFNSIFDEALKFSFVCMKDINITLWQHASHVLLILTNTLSFSVAFQWVEQSVTLMIIVHALNGRRTELAVISGTRSPPPFQFWRYLSHAPCWLVAPPADNWWLCATAQSSQLYAISLHAKVHTR